MNILYINNVMDVGGVEKCIIKLSKLMRANNKIVVATVGGKLEKELDLLNIKHYNLLNTDSKSPYTILKNLKIINKIIKEEKIDLVHSHHRMTTLYCKFLSKINNFKLIHTQHLCIEDKIRLTKLTLKNIPIITVSNSAKENLVMKYGLSKSNIKTIYNTIETTNNDYEIDKQLKNLNDKDMFTIAHISRLVDYKGIYDYLEIAKQISKKDTNIRFVIIGSGPEEENIKNYIKNNNLQEHIFLLGNKSNIINQLKYINLVLLCSYIEGLPLVPIESFSQGVPVIGTNIGGTNEEVIHGKNGYLVDTKDINGFIEKIMFIYENKDVYDEMKENSLEVYNEKFNEEQYYIKHIEFYSSILTK